MQPSLTSQPSLVQVTSDSYQPVGSSVNGSGFRPFDLVIPLSFRKGEITGEEHLVRLRGRRDALG